MGSDIERREREKEREGGRKGGRERIFAFKSVTVGEKTNNIPDFLLSLSKISYSSERQAPGHLGFSFFVK